MINSDLIQISVIDRPNLRMNNRGKIIGEYFEMFSPKSGLWSKVTYANWKL